MAVTTRDVQELEELERAWRAEPASEPHRSDSPPPLRTARGWNDELSTGWAAGGVLAWLVALTVITEVQPAASDEFSGPWWALALAVAFTALFMGTLVGFAMRRRWAFAASLAGAGLLTVDAVVCPATGHHPAGWWLVAPALGSVGLLALSVVGLRKA